MKDFKKALIVSFPVLVEYLFLGIGFGVLMTANGYHFLWSLFSAISTFAGAGQYLEADLLASSSPIYLAVLMTIAINIRYCFYGISFLDKTKKYRWYEKIYFYFALTDETYSLLVAHTLKDPSDTKKFDMWLCVLDHIYWISGCLLGALLGNLPIDFTGIDFIMTALFVVILVDQLRSKANPRLACLIGILSSIVSYLIFKENFIFPAIGLSTLFIFIFRKKLESKGDINE